MSRTSAPMVVHVISDAGPHRYFRTLIEAGGVDVSALAVGCIGPPGALQAEMRELGVETFALSAGSRTDYPRAVVSLARLLRHHGTAVVQTHLVDGSLVGLAAARLARTQLTVMTAHHSHELPYHGQRLLWADKACAGVMAHRVIAPSVQVAETLVNYAGIPRQKIEVVHHGFDLEQLDPGKVDGKSVRSQLGLDGALVFGAIGRIYRLKNYPALLEAFAALAPELPEGRLVIVGDGDVEWLHAQAHKLGLEEHVLVLGPRSDIPDLLAAFDVFVHPAIAESFGMVIIEAMAMARPVVSTPVGIAPEVIEPRLNGVLAESPSPSALHAALREAVALRPTWSELGAAARSRVQGFTARRMSARYSELYRDWLSRPR